MAASLQRRFTLLSLLLVQFLLIPHSVDGAHARKRPTVVVRRNANVYDRSITTFDPQGRLPQVTYGQVAAHKGSLILARNVISMMAENASNETSTTTTENETLVLVIPASTSSFSSTSSPYIHRLHDSIFLIGTGLVGDVATLAQNLRVWCQNQLYAMGERPTCAQVAQEAARIQHAVTLVPGNRPLGCAILIGGVDEDGNDHDHRVHLFSVGPGGGAVHEALCCALGTNHLAAQTQLVEQQQQNMKQQQQFTQQQFIQNEDSQSTTTKDSADADSVSVSLLEMAVHDMIQIYRDHSGKDSSTQEGKEDEFCQVWTLTPSNSKRGGLHVQCRIYSLQSSSSRRSWGSRVSRWVKQTFL